MDELSLSPPSPPAGAVTARSRALAADLSRFCERAFANHPWHIEVRDWTGQRYALGQGARHWSGRTLHVTLNNEAPARDVMRLDGMRFMERFLEGDVDFEGNLYALASLREGSGFRIPKWRIPLLLLRHVVFQNTKRARVNVKSHYDVPQEALDLYLDQTYRAYSCGMFEDPDDLDIEALLRIGQGEKDDFDSLEKSMWRKFKDAADYIAPRPGETLLDVGCGYGGQLRVALESQPFGKVVGWTLSQNQALEGQHLLSEFDPARWELNEGDYRQDERVYDHVTSTGMVSHVGPRGLVPYVRQVRRRIRSGGRYVHHALMTAYDPWPIDFSVGIAFNKKYVWPGFHWFTVGEHVRALEANGFQVERAVSLTRHYAKTTTAWYERMLANRDQMVRKLGEPTFRAWQVYLAGSTGAFLKKRVHVYRLYCEAV